jgi:ubiquinone/menaquinone biosynthesis C-methylase UbiE
MSEPRQTVYVCGHSPNELERLAIQGTFFKDITRRVFELAGLSAGMRVLDIGCGAGDVSFLAAEIVGPSGSVIGIDRAQAPVDAANARAAARVLSHATFHVSDIATFEPSVPFDAVVGRFVLMHQADPAETFRLAARLVRPGGLVAMVESHLIGLTETVHSFPFSPMYDAILKSMLEVMRAAGAHPDMGLRLREVFREAGLPRATLLLQARVEGIDGEICRYTTESVKSFLPTAERLGIRMPWMHDVADLEAQLSAELTTSGGVLTSPLVVGAWSRVR